MQGNSKSIDSKSNNPKCNTKWTPADEATLIDTLLKEKEKENWRDNNPKPTAYTAVEFALAGSEKVLGGSVKGILAIKSQWQRVCMTWTTCLTSADRTTDITALYTA